MYAFRERLRSSLMSAGLREIRSFPFASDADLTLTGDRDPIAITNPLDADEAYLRTRLTPGLLRAIRRNVYRHVRGAALFEVGSVFRSSDAGPEERPKAAFAMTGEAETERSWTGSRAFDVFDAKGVLEAVLADLGVGWSLGDPVGSPFHPGRSAVVLVDGERIGVMGEIHPRVAAALDVPGRIAAAELEVDALMRHAAGAPTVRDVPRFPPVRRDLAFLMDVGVPAGAVGSAIVEAGGDLLESCTLFDVHVGSPMPEGTKSLAFSLDFRDPQRTLEGDEVSAVVDAIVARIRDAFGGELRAG
jgi:phenylalanyl-tRNA synthetase beta chain